MDTVLAGLWPPVATPFADDGTIDERLLIRHSRTLLAEGARGLAVLGTTSEANSLTLDERLRVIDAHAEAGIPGSQLLPGTGACAIGDAAAVMRRAGEIGAAGVLLLPPFYYKQVSDDGLFAFVAAVIERAGASVPRIMLYHIPPMAIVGWSIDLVGRLVEAFPGIIAGMKDSSGDRAHTLRMIAAFPDLAIFPGAEVHLLEALVAGAAGCISASANVNAAAIARLIDARQGSAAESQQEALRATRKALEARGMIPSLKTVLARRYDEAAWLNLRPPLMMIDADARAALMADPAIAGLLQPVAA
jgi:4-hydroxy-tetrahydrodipicolinate synthase